MDYSFSSIRYDKKSKEIVDEFSLGFKKTNTWWIVDNKRDTTNPRTQVLRPSSSSAETTETTNVIFHTNGFEFPNGNSDTNENNYTYLFWAIAANPDEETPTLASSFNIETYTGTGNDPLVINGLGFSPGFVWIKVIDAAREHILSDIVRGPNKELSTKWRFSGRWWTKQTHW